MNEDEFKKTLEAGQKVFGADLWRDGKQREIETVVGRTDTWACKLLLWALILLWVYFLVTAVIQPLGWLMGFLILIPLHVAIYKLPVIIVMQPLNKEEYDEYVEQKSP